MQPKIFYIVLGNHLPKRHERFKTIQEATAKALELSKLHPDTVFYVLKAKNQIYKEKMFWLIKKNTD